jgi:MFS family permease
VTMFPEPREQAKAIGVYAFVASAGGSIGLLAGGVLTESINWHWIFFVNVPVGLATALLAARMLEHDEGIGLDGGADVPGAILVTGALMLGVYTIVEPALLPGAIAVALLAAFAAREATARTPLVPPRFLRSRDVIGSNLIQALGAAGMFGMFFIGALYMERVLGYDALQIGLAFLPVTIAMGTLSVRYAEPLISRFGARRTMVPGIALVAAGLALFARVPVDGSYVTDVLPTMVLLGVGAGLFFPALMTIAMASATPADAGLASGLVNTTAQVGGALGLAVLATLSYDTAFWVAAGLVTVALVVALTVLSPAATAGSGASRGRRGSASRADRRSTTTNPHPARSSG